MSGIRPTLRWFLTKLTQHGTGSISDPHFYTAAVIQCHVQSQWKISTQVCSGEQEQQEGKKLVKFALKRALLFKANKAFKLQTNAGSLFLKWQSWIWRLSLRKHIANEHSRHIRTDGNLLKTETLLSHMRQSTGQICNVRCSLASILPHTFTLLHPSCCAAPHLILSFLFSFVSWNIFESLAHVTCFPSFGSWDHIYFWERRCAHHVHLGPQWSAEHQGGPFGRGLQHPAEWCHPVAGGEQPGPRRLPAVAHCEYHSSVWSTNRPLNFLIYCPTILYSRVPQILPWRSNLLQSLAPALIKLTYLWCSNDLEDSD